MHWQCLKAMTITGAAYRYSLPSLPAVHPRQCTRVTRRDNVGLGHTNVSCQSYRHAELLHFWPFLIQWIMCDLNKSVHVYVIQIHMSVQICCQWTLYGDELVGRVDEERHCRILMKLFAYQDVFMNNYFVLQQLCWWHHKR